MNKVDRLPIDFAADCGSARRADGSEVQFTRTERQLLRDLMAHPGRLRSRNDLLDAIAEPGTDASDRNVDFHINRLRTKLADPARRPRYIQTRYGEGYMWIGPRRQEAGKSQAPFILVGPLTGLDLAIDAICLEFARELADALRGQLAEDRTAVIDPSFLAGQGNSPQFQLELRFLKAGAATDCISVLRCPGHPVLNARRDNAIAPGDGGRAAGAHLEALWAALADWDAREGPDAAPLDLRIATAAQHFAATSDPDDLPAECEHFKGEAYPPAGLWRSNEARLRKRIAEGGGTPEARLMLAVTIQSRYIIDGWRFLARHDPRARDDAEMQELVLPVLPALMSDPQHALTAAKALTLLGPAFRQLGLEIAEEAFRKTTALGHALPILGKLRCLAGQFDSGLALLRQAHGLVKPGSVAERYVVSLICQNLLASGDFAEKDRMLMLLTRSPLAKGPLRLVYASPGETEPSLPVRLHLRISPRRYARSTLLWSYWIAARHFVLQDARENVILGLAGHLSRHYGADVIPPEVAAAIPAVLGQGPVAHRSHPHSRAARAEGERSHM